MHDTMATVEDTFNMTRKRAVGVIRIQLLACYHYY